MDLMRGGAARALFEIPQTHDLKRAGLVEYPLVGLVAGLMGFVLAKAGLLLLTLKSDALPNTLTLAAAGIICGICAQELVEKVRHQGRGLLKSEPTEER